MVLQRALFLTAVCVVVRGEDAPVGQHHKGRVYDYDYGHKPVIPMPRPHVDKMKHAKTYNVSEPIYICTKPEYIQHGEKCIYTDTVPARWQCPVGFTPIGPDPNHPEICKEHFPASPFCPHGRLVGHECVVTETCEATLVCPPGTEHTHDGRCVRYEPVQPTEHCPHESQRIGGECVIVTYTPPEYICPHNTVQEGRRCRREVITVKEPKEKAHNKAWDKYGDPHKRKLGDVVRGQRFQDDELFVGLPDSIFRNDNVPLSRATAGGQGTSSHEFTWLPATDAMYEDDEDDWEQEPPLPLGEWGAAEEEWEDDWITPTSDEWRPVDMAPYKQPYEDGYNLAHKDKDGHGKKDKEKDKSKEIKIKIPGPSHILRIQYIPADRICHVGERHGSTCVSQSTVQPIIRCPVPLIHGQCVRQVPIPPTATCPHGYTLVCPPHIAGAHCRCERSTKHPAEFRCPKGHLEPRHQTCTIEAEPKEYCPLGYFLDKDHQTCTKRDVEPALCLFTVTYICPPDANC